MSTEEENKLLERQIELMEKRKDLQVEHNRESERYVKIAEKGRDTQKEAYKEAEDFGKGVGDTLGGLLGTSSGLSASMKKLASGTLDADKMFQGFTKSIGANFSAMTIGISILEKVKEATIGLVYATDSALVSFQKQTGAVSLYGAKIIALEEQNYNFGISMDEASEAQASLVMGIKNFNTFSGETQEKLLRTTAILNELGVEGSLTSQSLNFMTNSLGMTADQADQTTREMFVLAKSMGMPPQEMAESFASAQPQLAAFGKRAGDVFSKLAINARAATMEVGDILRITEQFDKFDTAAAAVGKLNAALGGPYLSTIRMVTTTDPTERIKMMSNAARQAGRSFDEMDYYERKMIASAMGLKDVNELALVMRNRFDLVGESVERSAADIEKLAEQTQEYNTIMEEFSQVVRAFAIPIAGPIVKALKVLADSLTYLAQNPMVWVTTGIGLMTAALITLIAASGGTMAPIAAFIGVLAGAAIVLKGVYDLISKSKPLMDKFTNAWEKITKKFEVFSDQGAGASSVLDQLVEGVDQFVSDAEPFIDMILEDIVGSIAIMIDNVLEMNKVLTDIGAWKFIGRVVAGFAIGILGAVSATLKLVTWIQWFTRHLTPIALLFGGWRDTMKDLGSMFGYVADEVTRMSNAISDSIPEMAEIGEFAESLPGFSKVKFVAESVKNGTFTRSGDLERQNDDMASAVADAVKEAMESATLNVSSQLEVLSDDSMLGSLFNFMHKNMDDVQSGRPPQIYKNAAQTIGSGG